MNYIQRKIINLAAYSTFAVVYFLLRGHALRLDIAVCASYTFVVFFKARRKRENVGLFQGEDAIPVVELLLGHLLALAFIIAIVRLGVYAAPVLPRLLITPVGTAPGGQPMPTPLRYLQTGMVFLVGFIEFWWLTSIKTSEEKEQQGRIILSKDAHERYLANRLRLR
jgi:hypothetical protein